MSQDINATKKNGRKIKNDIILVSITVGLILLLMLGILLFGKSKNKEESSVSGVILEEHSLDDTTENPTIVADKKVTISVGGKIFGEYHLVGSSVLGGGGSWGLGKQCTVLSSKLFF